MNMHTLTLHTKALHKFLTTQMCNQGVFPQSQGDDDQQASSSSSQMKDEPYIRMVQIISRSPRALIRKTKPRITKPLTANYSRAICSEGNASVEKLTLTVYVLTAVSAKSRQCGA